MTEQPPEALAEEGICTRMTDEAREKAVQRELANMEVCQAIGNSARARKHWLAAARLITARSKEQVGRMERAKGLV